MPHTNAEKGLVEAFLVQLGAVSDGHMGANSSSNHRGNKVSAVFPEVVPCFKHLILCKNIEHSSLKTI
jgi:hypothetical protein